MKLILIALALSSLAYGEVLKREGDHFSLSKTSFSALELLNDYVKAEKLNLNIRGTIKDLKFTNHGSPRVPTLKIEKYVSTILAMSGHAMIRMPESKQIYAFPVEEVRYTATPIFKKIEDIPDNENYIQLAYSLKHIDASSLARNMRPFMGKWGRIIDVANSGTIHIADTGVNVLRQARLIQLLDTEEFAKSKKEIDEINEKHKKMTIKEKSWYKVLLENQGLFLLVFLLLGLIIGFGSRGYMMKKIEGGW